MNRGKIIAVIAGIAILLGGGGAYWYYQANNSPTANHTLNLSNVNTKHALQGLQHEKRKIKKTLHQALLRKTPEKQRSNQVFKNEFIMMV